MKSRFDKAIRNMSSYLHSYVKNINDSKLFAGLMIITLNIASKFVTIKLSKTMESYLKYTFSKQILIFAIAWMGTRDIYIALFVTIVFIICMDFLFHEDSALCCLPESFTSYHIDKLENDPTPSAVTNNPSISIGGSTGGASLGSSTGSTGTATANSSSNNNNNNSNNNSTVTDAEIKQAQEVLEKAKKQNTQLQYQNLKPYN